MIVRQQALMLSSLVVASLTLSACIDDGEQPPSNRDATGFPWTDTTPDATTEDVVDAAPDTAQDSAPVDALDTTPQDLIDPTPDTTPEVLDPHPDLTVDGLVLIDCVDTVRDTNLSSGYVADIYCEGDCFKRSVWGTDIYTSDSNICTAAIHAGAITSSGGIARMHVLTGDFEYLASERNGVSTYPWSTTWSLNFRFVSPAP